LQVIPSEFPEIDKEAKERLVLTPECLEEHVAATNAVYKDTALQPLEVQSLSFLGIFRR